MEDADDTLSGTITWVGVRLTHMGLYSMHYNQYLQSLSGIRRIGTHNSSFRDGAFRGGSSVDLRIHPGGTLGTGVNTLLTRARTHAAQQLDPAVYDRSGSDLGRAGRPRSSPSPLGASWLAPAFVQQYLFDSVCAIRGSAAEHSRLGLTRPVRDTLPH